MLVLIDVDITLLLLIGTDVGLTSANCSYFNLTTHYSAVGDALPSDCKYRRACDIPGGDRSL